MCSANFSPNKAAGPNGSFGAVLSKRKLGWSMIMVMIMLITFFDLLRVGVSLRVYRKGGE